MILNKTKYIGKFKYNNFVVNSAEVNIFNKINTFVVQFTEVKVYRHTKYLSKGVHIKTSEMNYNKK